MEQFFCGTRLACGMGAVSALKTLESKRLLVVSDPFFQENGTAKRLAEAAEAGEVAFFSKIVPDPSVELAAEGTAFLKEFGPDTVLALGGGSAIDCAKAMVFFSGLPVRFVAVPTTSGSGSEVTDFAVLTHGKGKYPLVDPRLRPEMAILDGELVATMPRSLAADGGFDVLSHALEAYVAKNSSAFSNTLAREAFCTVYALLPASCAGNRQVRQRIHEASAMAGMAFNTAGLGLCHGLAHALGGAFSLPHGRINAILLPAVVECNAAAAGEKYARLAMAAAMGGSAVTLGVRNLKNGLIRLRRELGLPDTLSQAGIRPQRVRQCREALVKAAMEDPCCRTNPVPVEAYAVRRILEAVTGNG